VVWVTTTDPNFFSTTAYFAHVTAQLYNNDTAGTLLAGPLIPPAPATPASRTTAATNVVISGDNLTTDSLGDASLDAFGVEYGYNAATRTYSVSRPQFRLNSSAINGAAAGVAAWPFSQGNAQVGLDADGDLTATYNGYGPDMSESSSFRAAPSRA